MIQLKNWKNQNKLNKNPINDKRSPKSEQKSMKYKQGKLFKYLMNPRAGSLRR